MRALFLFLLVLSFTPLLPLARGAACCDRPVSRAGMLTKPGQAAQPSHCPMCAPSASAPAAASWFAAIGSLWGAGLGQKFAAMLRPARDV